LTASAAPIVDNLSFCFSARPYVAGSGCRRAVAWMPQWRCHRCSCGSRRPWVRKS